MLDISIENTHCEISKDSNHSYDVLEEYTPFIPTLNQSKRRKMRNHMFYLRCVVRSLLVATCFTVITYRFRNTMLIMSPYGKQETYTNSIKVILPVKMWQFRI